MSHASGLHERARLYRPLFAGMHRSFGYDVLEPVHRDFSVVLERCGDDLDRAVAAIPPGQDYRRPSMRATWPARPAGTRS